MLSKLSSTQSDSGELRFDDVDENKVISLNSRRLQQILGQKNADQLYAATEYTTDSNPVAPKSNNSVINLEDAAKVAIIMSKESYNLNLVDENLSKGIYALQIIVIAMSFALVLLLTAYL